MANLRSIRKEFLRSVTWSICKINFTEKTWNATTSEKPKQYEKLLRQHKKMVVGQTCWPILSPLRYHRVKTGLLIGSTHYQFGADAKPILRRKHYETQRKQKSESSTKKCYNPEERQEAQRLSHRGKNRSVWYGQILTMLFKEEASWNAISSRKQKQYEKSLQPRKTTGTTKVFVPGLKLVNLVWVAFKFRRNDMPAAHGDSFYFCHRIHPQCAKSFSDR